MSKEELKDQISSIIKQELGREQRSDLSSVLKSPELEAEKKKIELELIKEQLKKIDYMLETYVCPISTEIMKNPVIAEDGQTYEEMEINKWFKANDISPITRKKIGKKLTKNYKAKESIEDLQKQRKTLEGRIGKLGKY